MLDEYVSYKEEKGDPRISILGDGLKTVGLDF